MDYDFKDVLIQENTPTLMFVSMELEARKSPKGWKPRLVMLALCPIRVLKTEHRKQQGHLFASLSNCAMFSKRTGFRCIKTPLHVGTDDYSDCGVQHPLLEPETEH